MQKRQKVNDDFNYDEYLRQKAQLTDEFGGYSKSWIQSMANEAAQKEDLKDDSYCIESISALIGIDIDKKAKEIISKISPFGRRQIAKPVNS